jgi:DNA-binding transcriptional ArsR family regulator
MKRSSENFEYSPDTEEMAKFAKALAHPARIIILKHLSTSSCCFTGDLLEVLPLAQSTISQHLKELKEAGLIQGEVHPPKVRYCINNENWQKARTLFDDIFDEDFSKIDCC